MGTNRLPAKNPRYGRQLDPVEPVERVPGDDADQDAAEHAGVQRLQAQHRLGLEATCDGDDAHRSVHHQVADRRGERRDAVVLGNAERDADREDQPEGAEDGVAGALQDLQEGIEGLRDDARGEWITDDDRGRLGQAGQLVSGDGNPVDRAVAGVDGRLPVVADEGAADTEQDARDRQHGHRQHQRLSELLQEAEEVAPDLLQRVGGRLVGGGRRAGGCRRCHQVPSADGRVVRVSTRRRRSARVPGPRRRSPG